MAVAQITRSYLTEREAADYLGFRPATLRQSRHLKVLAGVTPPGHVNIGRNIRYDIAELERWLSANAKTGAAQ